MQHFARSVKAKQRAASCVLHVLLALQAAVVVSQDDMPILTPEELAAEAAVRHKWYPEVPHQPTDALAQALQAAAWLPTPPLPSNTKGLVMVTHGSFHTLVSLLPRWLDSLSWAHGGDLTPHALVVTLGPEALELCQGHAHRHYCVPQSNWPGPARQYHFGDPWYVAVTLSKVELILNILNLGYSPLWLDTDIVHMRNPLPFMADLEAQGVHVAVSAENCLTLMLPAPNGTQHAIEDFDHNTGVLFVSVAALSARFVRQWLNVQKQHLMEWGPEDYDPHDVMQRRSDQVTFNRHAVPAVLRSADTWRGLNLVQLPKSMFPNWCGGPCGCEGNAPRNATRFLRHDNRLGHLITGRILCPQEIASQWFNFHFPCCGSTHEKLALIDAYQALHYMRLLPMT